MAQIKLKKNLDNSNI